MWGFIIGIGAAIWDAFQGVADASLAVLWGIVTTIGSALAALGTALWAGVKDVWGFVRPAWDTVIKPLVEDVGKAVWKTLKSLYTDILKPAWAKLNKLVDRLHTWLQTKFAPILCWMYKARAYINHIYDKYIRPIITLIDIAKQVMGMLASLGVAWARQIEQDLSELEQKIEAPFQYVLSKLNEAINAIDRIVDLDGLFQRLTLLRSLVRDAENSLRILHNLRLQDLTPDDRTAAHDAQHGKKVDAAQQDVVDAIVTGGGADGPLTDEMAQIWLTAFQSALS
jgi:hypothetical protein